MVEKTAAFRQRRAADTARWRERLHRGAGVYPVEVEAPNICSSRPCCNFNGAGSSQSQMLALTDSALARLCIGAPAVPHERRRRWLRDIADRIDPPPPRILARRERSRRRRRRCSNGDAVFPLVANHDAVLLALIESRKLSEQEALDCR